jgi:hypothetical protein
MVDNYKAVSPEVDWLCPVCNSNTNSLGTPFSGSRAVALHVAGKIRTGDRLHRSWAIGKIGNTVDKPEAKHSINTLADQLEWYVLEDNRTRHQKEEERIKRLAEEEKGKEDPGVLAYKYVQRIETSLHAYVRQALQTSFGEDEKGWWVQGVPPQIRIACAQRREEDRLREEPYRYINLIDLRTIIDKNWGIFVSSFGQVHESLNSKKKFLAGIARTNEIRNRVMHTIRMVPTAEDILFLRQFSETTEKSVQKV